MLKTGRISKLWQSPRTVALVAIFAVMVYAIWIGGPYLRSIAVRDAAVTTWITTVYSPIAGRIDDDPLHAGERAGPDRRIAGITNERLSQVDLVRAQAELDRANATLAALTSRVAALEAMESRHASIARTFAESFVADLDAEIASLRPLTRHIRDALALERIEAERQASMRDTGASSKSAADLAAIAAIDRERLLTETEAKLLRAEQRRTAADNGVFILFDGTDAGVAQRRHDETAAALERARAEHAEMVAKIQALRAVRDATAMSYETARTATIEAPEGAMVWSLIAGPAVEVQPGTAIATWIDCSVLLVDAPISDLEAALLVPGALAEVTFEGESRVRTGSVLFTRGGAATIASSDLAAVAKGREPGTGQALIALTPDADDIAQCRIGDAAFVDFPGIGVIDMVRARLRL
jgi:multidrug efflux pump subunit AcrA (membrane-fusion protein)